MFTGEVGKLTSWLGANGIEVVLFDLDDTLLNTHPIFDRQIDAFIALAVSRLPEYQFKSLLEMLKEINDQAFRTHGVNPNRWETVVVQMGERCGERAREVFNDGLPTLMEIYQIVPPVLPGAIQMLNLFNQTGVDMGLVTHANQKWTGLKLDNTGLRPFFQHILVVDEDRHKGSNDWASAASLFDKGPDQGMAVGDNLRGDVIAAAEAGFKKIVWVDKKDGWSMYRSGEVPEGVIVVSGVGVLSQALLGMDK